MPFKIYVDGAHRNWIQKGRAILYYLQAQKRLEKGYLPSKKKSLYMFLGGKIKMLSEMDCSSDGTVKRK